MQVQNGINGNFNVKIRFANVANGIRTIVYYFQWLCYKSETRMP